jgi:hypothetical protein
MVDLKKGLASSPENSPFVIDALDDEQVYAAWGASAEHSLLVVLEAHRRLQAETGDARTAAALTLAWATHFARPE